MCGIYGSTKVDRVLMEEMTKASSYRGPDGTGFCHMDDIGVSLGFNHLNISQPSSKAVSQPYMMDSGNVLVWSGEIYGIQEPDTAWLARNCELYGPQFLRSHDGMWAAAWVDKRARELTLIRDHFGTKPLFYTVINDVLYFASSLHSLAGIPGIVFEADEDMVDVAREIGNFVPGPRTIYKNIHKVAPGEWLTWSLTERKFVRKGSLLDFMLHPLDEQRFDLDYFKHMLLFSVQQASRNRWKTGVQLSGGVDSSVIMCALANQSTMNVTAFTVAYHYQHYIKRTQIVDHQHDQYYESVLAQATARYYGKACHVVDVTDEQYMEDITHDVAMFAGIPLQDRARWYPRIKLASVAKKKGMKVLLNGDFGDELFVPFLEERGKDSIQTGDVFARFSEKTAAYLSSWLPTLSFGPDMSNNRRMVDAIIYGEMYNMLSDATAAYFGMEARPVFCHQSLAFYCFNVPTTIKAKKPAKYTGINYKYMVRESLKNDLPPHILSNNAKVGWAVPWNSKQRDIVEQGFMRDLQASMDALNSKKFKTS